jgi:hypothetical protein
MGNPFLFADRFSGAVVHLTTDGPKATFPTTLRTTWQFFNVQKDKMPATANWRRHFD